MSVLKGYQDEDNFEFTVGDDHYLMVSGQLAVNDVDYESDDEDTTYPLARAHALLLYQKASQ